MVRRDALALRRDVTTARHARRRRRVSDDRLDDAAASVVRRWLAANALLNGVAPVGSSSSAVCAEHLLTRLWQTIEAPRFLRALSHHPS